MKILSSSYPFYQISQCEWIDKIPKEWSERRVKDLFYLVTNIAPADNNFELLSLYTSIGVKPRKDMEEQRGNKSITTDHYWIVKKGDIIVNKLLAWMGAVGLSAFDGVTSPAYDVLRRKRKINREVDERFYTYLFRTEKAKQIFKKHSRGIMDVRLRLYFEKLGALTVPCPAFLMQNKIAASLDATTTLIDRKIELLYLKADKYAELKQAMINETVTRGLDKSVPLKESGVEWVGKIPVHWGMKRLKEIAKIKNSNVDKKSHNHEMPIRLCNYIDVYKNSYIDSAIDFMQATADENEIRQFNIRINDVLITKDSESFDDIAVPALAMESMADVLCGYHLAQIRVKEKEILGPFLFRLFQSKKYGIRFIINAKGITRYGLGQSAISDAITPVPPIQEQKIIIKYLDAKTAQIDKIISTIRLQISKLEELRKTLINDVVTGKIKV